MNLKHKQVQWIKESYEVHKSVFMTAELNWCLLNMGLQVVITIGKYYQFSHRQTLLTNMDMLFKYLKGNRREILI